MRPPSDRISSAASAPSSVSFEPDLRGIVDRMLDVAADQPAELQNDRSPPPGVRRDALEGEAAGLDLGPEARIQDPHRGEATFVAPAEILETDDPTLRAG